MAKGAVLDHSSQKGPTQRWCIFGEDLCQFGELLELIQASQQICTLGWALPEQPRITLGASPNGLPDHSRQYDLIIFKSHLCQLLLRYVLYKTLILAESDGSHHF